MASNDKTAVYIIGIVAIVAAVGLIVVITGSSGGYENSDISGAVIAPTYTKWTTCLDQGNVIKLGNKEAGTLVKKDVCTGTADKMVSRVNCAQDIDGYYTYKYTNADSCSQDKTCKTDDTGAAYCG